MKKLQIGRFEESIMFDREEVAERLGIHVRTVQAWQKAGKLQSRKIGRRYFSTDVEIWESVNLKTPRQY